MQEKHIPRIIWEEIMVRGLWYCTLASFILGDFQTVSPQAFFTSDLKPGGSSTDVTISLNTPYIFPTAHRLNKMGFLVALEFLTSRMRVVRQHLLLSHSPYGSTSAAHLCTALCRDPKAVFPKLWTLSPWSFLSFSPVYNYRFAKGQVTLIKRTLHSLQSH